MILQYIKIFQVIPYDAFILYPTGEKAFKMTISHIILNQDQGCANGFSFMLPITINAAAGTAGACVLEVDWEQAPGSKVRVERRRRP